MNINNSFLKTENLAVGYQGKILIDSINMQVKRGEILALIGPNGAGKSTILKTLTRNLASIEGVIFLEQADLKSINNQEFAKKEAIVVTDKIKTELMTCEDVVSTGRHPFTGKFGILQKEDKYKIQEAMELVNVLSIKEQDFTKISDGQRQRVLLAKAICQEPQVIILDEPTSFLDIHYKLEVLQIIKRLAKEKNIAIIVSMHEIDLAQKIADQVLCVKDNKATYYANPTDIFQQDKIAALYDMKQGSYNPLFGSLEMERVMGTPEVFVIAGNGTGVEVYRKLQKNNIPFITGILHRNDVDYQVAQAIASDIVSEESFEIIREETLTAAKAKMKLCKFYKNCLHTYGTMNQYNEVLLQYAVTLGLQELLY